MSPASYRTAPPRRPMLATPNPERQAHRLIVRFQPSHIVNPVEASSPIPAGTLEDMDRQIGIPSNPNDESPRKAVLALVAHDEKKDDLLRLAKRYRSSLARLHLLATFHTGALLSEEVGLPVERFGSGPEGGDIQIGARIVQGDPTPRATGSNLPSEGLNRTGSVWAILWAMPLAWAKVRPTVSPSCSSRRAPRPGG